jgi:NADPH:quinone reductase-like Zn-dependent oxidoreductase
VLAGLLRPRKIRILGGAIAGQVEVVGRSVKQLQTGNEVFEDIFECGWGGFADYVCERGNALLLKSVGMAF